MASVWTSVPSLAIVHWPMAARFPASPRKISSSRTNASRWLSSPTRMLPMLQETLRGAPLLLASEDPATPEKLAQARKIFEGLQHGTLDRSLYTDNANFYFNEVALKDFANSLGSLGTPEEFTQTSQGLRGGMKLRIYRIKFPKVTLSAWTYEMPDGKLEQYQVAAQ